MRNTIGKLTPADVSFTSNTGVHTHTNAGGGRSSVVTDIISRGSGGRSSTVAELASRSSGGRSNTVAELVSRGSGGRSSVVHDLTSRGSGGRLSTVQELAASRSGGRSHVVTDLLSRSNGGSSSGLPDGVSVSHVSRSSYDAWLQGCYSRPGGVPEYLRSQIPQTNMSTQVAVSSSNRLFDNSVMTDAINYGPRDLNLDGMTRQNCVELGNMLGSMTQRIRELNVQSDMLNTRVEVLERAKAIADVERATAIADLERATVIADWPVRSSNLSLELARMGLEPVGELGATIRRSPNPLRVTDALGELGATDALGALGATIRRPSLRVMDGLGELGATIRRPSNPLRATDGLGELGTTIRHSPLRATQSAEAAQAVVPHSVEAGDIVNNYVDAVSFATSVISRVDTPSCVVSIPVNVLSDASRAVMRAEQELVGFMRCIENRIFGSATRGPLCEFYDFADWVSVATHEYMVHVSALKKELAQKSIEQLTTSVELLEKAEDVRLMRGHADQYRLAMLKLMEAVNLNGIDSATVAQISSELATLLSSQV